MPGDGGHASHFVSCKKNGQWRDEANRDLVDGTELKLLNMQIEGALKNGLLNTANLKLFFMNSAVIWPLDHLLFSLGQIPNLNPLILKEAGNGDIAQRRLRLHLSSNWHTSSIQLSGQIFGDYQQRMAVLNNHAKRC